MNIRLIAFSLAALFSLAPTAQAEWVSGDEAAAKPAADEQPAETPLFRNTESLGAVSAYERAFSPYEAAGMNVDTGRGGYLRYGGVFVYPSLSLGMGYNDNVLGTKNDRTSSTVLTVQPTINAEYATNGDVYDLTYSGLFARYLNSQDDDFSTHKLDFKAQQTYTARLRLDYGVGYQQGSTARGALTDGSTRNSPDKWQGPTANIKIAFGADQARGRVEVESQYFRKVYTNHRDVMSLYDLESTQLAERFYWRVMPRTALLFEARQTWNDYLDSASNFGNTGQAYLVGATWNATAKTTGIAKVGWNKKDFDNGNTATGNIWEAAVTWSPRTYSTVNFQTKRSIDDSTGVGDYQINREYAVAWTHNWNSFLASHVNYSLLNTTFGNSQRDDDISTYSVGLTYALRRWLTLGANAIHSDRDSSEADLDYKRNVLMLTAGMTL